MSDKLAVLDRSSAAPVAVAPGFDFSNIDTEAIKRKFLAIEQFQHLVGTQLKKGLDVGVIPGTGDKPTLLKPGAEKIAKLLNCFDQYEIVSATEDWDKPLFRYLIRCTLIEMSTGTSVSSGLGECNSWESKYRWRWVPEAQIPAALNKDSLQKRDGKKKLFEFDFAIEKRETTGNYGKPEAHWAAFDAAIQNGTAVRVERETKSKKKFWGHEITIGETYFRIPNPDVFDQINTILKMAKKRAMVDAALSAGRLSDLFTQDLEDLFGEAAAQMEQEPAVAAPAKPEEATKPKAAPAAAPSADPEPDPGVSDLPDETESANRATDDQIKAIGLKIVALGKHGISPTKALEQMYLNVKEKFGTTFVQFDELTFEEADYVDIRLGAWLDMKSKKGAAK